MNKDVIYIEPEDDITDIITKIENSKEKIVALVPPKKAGVLRSVVNIKLITKAATSAKKTAVLVTTDPSIMKLAAATKLPVTKDLQSAPAIPEADTEDDGGEVAKEDVVDEEAVDEEEKKEDKEEAEDEEEESKRDEESDEDEEEKGKKKGLALKKDKKKKSKNKFLAFFTEHKVLAIILGLFLIALILFVIWALVIAPAVNVFVSIKTDTNNFSETVSFVKEQDKEDIKEGKLYLEERKIETSSEVKFEPTGRKNIGEKASGEVVVYKYFGRGGGIVPINAGTVFSISGLSFSANESIQLSWDGKDVKDCDNHGDISIMSGCLIYARVSVTANGAGTKYNIAAANNGWDAVANLDGVYSDKAMGGGTDNYITVVQQSDIEKARNELNNGKEEENKEKLYATINRDDNIIIESTFKQTTSAAVSTPAVDEEVKEGVEPTLKTTTTIVVYTVDKTKLEELIKEKINLAENKKIFEIRNVYIDGFKELDSGFTGKIKAVYFTGPRITESELVEKIMGKGIGDARREIKDIEGISEVKMEPSYPWVMSVPTDSNRISMTFEIKDQEGNEIKEKSEEKPEEKGDEKTEEKAEDSKEE